MNAYPLFIYLPLIMLKKMKYLRSEYYLKNLLQWCIYVIMIVIMIVIFTSGRTTAKVYFQPYHFKDKKCVYTEGNSFTLSYEQHIEKAVILNRYILILAERLFFIVCLFEWITRLQHLEWWANVYIITHTPYAYCQILEESYMSLEFCLPIHIATKCARPTQEAVVRCLYSSCDVQTLQSREVVLLQWAS